jgi:hypothetical protein
MTPSGFAIRWLLVPGTEPSRAAPARLLPRSSIAAVLAQIDDADTAAWLGAGGRGFNRQFLGLIAYLTRTDSTHMLPLGLFEVTMGFLLLLRTLTPPATPREA